MDGEVMSWGREDKKSNRVGCRGQNTTVPFLSSLRSVCIQAGIRFQNYGLREAVLGWSSNCVCHQNAVWVAQSCLILFYPMNCHPPGSSVHGIPLLQGIFLTQGSNPRLLRWQAGSLPLLPPIRVPSFPREEGVNCCKNNRRNNSWYPKTWVLVLTLSLAYFVA